MSSPVFDVHERVRVVSNSSYLGEKGTVVARHAFHDKYRYHIAMDVGAKRAPVVVFSEKELERV